MAGRRAAGLLCLGKPGTGKTTIASFIVDTLFEKYGTDSSIRIAFLYPSFQQLDERPGQLLRSILLQLCKRLSSVPSALMDLQHRFNNSTSMPSIEDLFDVLQEVVLNMSKVYLVVDALDELSVSDRRKLVPGFLKLQNSLQLSLLATARPLLDVIQQFKTFPIFYISTTAARDELDIFIDTCIASLPISLQIEESLAKITHAAVK